VALAGEALPRPLVEQLYEEATVERIFNLYGPTEDTTYSTFARMERGGMGTPSIGRPIAETSAYVVGRSVELVGLGVAGELLLGGGGLARGYLRRPELTAERFVPDAYSGVPGARLYRTGDLVRRRLDGNLDFLGRLDHQVKVRGFRIELGEIESALAEHPAVREVVVMVRQDDPAVPRLVAYVVPAAGERPSPGQLRDLLAVRVPDFMMPAIFVVLDALPLTPSGKLDRAALPAPSTARPELTAAFVPPQSEMERELAALWREVLGIEQVGVNDSFFALGGDSLLLLRVHIKVHERYRQDLKIADLFRYTTIGSLAAYLTGGAQETAAVEDGSRQAASRRASEERRAQIRDQRRAARQSREHGRD
jgi:acyl carrier protein